MLLCVALLDDIALFSTQHSALGTQYYVPGTPSGAMGVSSFGGRNVPGSGTGVATAHRSVDVRSLAETPPLER
jgi:hypothetical protein